jgi:hypothetical protein
MAQIAWFLRRVGRPYQPHLLAKQISDNYIGRGNCRGPKVGQGVLSSAPEIEGGETEDRDFTHELYYCADDQSVG